MENSILAMIGIFISVAIMLSIGTQILGGAIQDCDQLPGAAYTYTYNKTNSADKTEIAYLPSTTAPPAPSGYTLSTTTAAAYTAASNIGWAQQCETNNSQTQSAYTLLIIIMIVIAAVAILSVVRML